MRKWLGKTSIRFVIVLLIVVLAAFMVTWWPTHQAKRLIVKQKSLSSQAVSQLNQAQTLLNSLPALDAGNLRKVGAIKFYADQAVRISNQFNRLDIVRPPDLEPILGISTNGEFTIIKDVNFTLSRIHQKTVYTNARNDTAAADNLMNYHAAVSSALINILEYDPVADTQGFDLKSADTQKRLQLAHDGLIKTDQQLQAAKKIYQDSSIDQITALISSLRYARYSLSQSGDIAAWIAAVENAQSQIIQNRIAFWKSEPQTIVPKLKSDQAQMDFIHGLWQADANKYGLT